MDHAVRAVSLGRNVGGNIVGLDSTWFPMLPRAGRMVTLARHSGSMRATSAMVEPPLMATVSTLPKRSFKSRAPRRPQFFLSRLIAVTVAGNDVDIFQTQLLPDLTLDVIEVIQAQEAFPRGPA